MNATEITALLGICASADNRKPNPEMVQFWQAALGDLDFVACRDAVVAHYQESTDWIMPAHIRTRVRRARASRIAIDEALELPPHDPDDTGAHIAALTWSRSQAAAGQPYEPEGLVRRGSIAAIGGPVRRVNELEDNDRRSFAEKAKAARRVALAELTAAPEPEPTAAVVFACEVVVDDQPCGDPAPNLSADRRRPLCDDHKRDETTTPPEPEALVRPEDRLREGDLSEESAHE